MAMSTVRKPTYRKMAQAVSLALALATGCGGLAQAQANDSSSPPPEQSQISTRWSVPASRVIGMEVENRQGEQLGEVIDLIVDSSDDEVEYAVLSFGGVGTLADKLFAYPLHRFDRTAARDANKLVLNVTRESLEDAPGFDRSLWPDFDRSEYRDQIERYYGKLAGSSDARYVRVSQMMDGDVKDAGGNDIGDIHDLAIDMVGGGVHYVVLEFEDDWVSRDQLVAVPMRGLNADDADGTDLVYPASRQELVQAPSFDEERWPEIVSNVEFQSQIDRYHTYWSSTAAAQ
jgi:sporulation protein YlmC with PRC-barrel domain